MCSSARTSFAFDMRFLPDNIIVEHREFGLTNASQFDWMGMSVRTETHRYIEWRAWDGIRLAPVWIGPPVAVELYEHDPNDGAFNCFVNSEGRCTCRQMEAVARKEAEA
eukprot:SAG31_NODE_10077_length_1187_cov_0.733456_2_plen_108_part_01